MVTKDGKFYIGRGLCILACRGEGKYLDAGCQGQWGLQGQNNPFYEQCLAPAGASVDGGRRKKGEPVLAVNSVQFNNEEARYFDVLLP